MFSNSWIILEKKIDKVKLTLVDIFVVVMDLKRNKVNQCVSSLKVLMIWNRKEKSEADTTKKLK